MATFYETIFGRPERNYQESRYSPQIQGGLDRLIQQGIGQQRNNVFDFAPVEQQARKDFQTKTVPTIANRFLTGSNSRNSGNFQHVLASSGKELDLGLAQLKNQFGQQNFQNLMQLLGAGSQQAIHRPETFGLAGELVRSVPKAAGAYFGAGGNLGILDYLRGLKSGEPETSPSGSVQGAQKTEGGQTNAELQNIILQLFGALMGSQNNQDINDQSSQAQYPQQGDGLTQIQQLVKYLGTPEGQFANRNIYNQRFSRGY